MKAFDIIQQIEKNEQPEAALSRRDALNKGFRFGIKTAITAIPFGMLLKSNKSYAFGPLSAIDILNFALKLEYLESEFYKMGLAAPSLIPSSDSAVISQISKHESAHVTLLQGAITASGGMPVSKPAFDFTAKGVFPDVFTNYATFLALANAFEDTGVRAYKGQAGGLAGTDTLTVALDIHSVEARHASEIRRLRGQKGWITGKSTMGVPAAVYGGTISEDNIVQGGVDVTTITTSSIGSVQEAFDEPLTMEEVLAIASPFFA